MKLDKTNVCVYIENEAQLKEARELLEKCGERIDARICDIKRMPKLVRFMLDGVWGFTSIGTTRKEVTPSELETILKSEQ